MSIELYGLPNGMWFKGRFIREGDGLYLNDSMEFFRGGLNRMSRCIKASGEDAGVCIRKENTTIMKQRDFHRHCRVVYRAMRKNYGIEKVQDECLRYFKVFFPVYHRAKNGEEVRFSDLDIERTQKIFRSWNAKEGAVLYNLCESVLQEMANPTRDIQEFCNDCMVVVMRIRKLSTREAGRLMSVDEKSLDIMLNCGISKSALYRCFGNSIVCGTGTKDSQGNYDGVLFNIFRKMFIETGPDTVKGQPTQLALF